MSAHYAGIDSGSWNTKAAVIDDAGVLRGQAIVRSGADLLGAARQALDMAARQAFQAPSDLAATWATGFGRHPVQQNWPLVAGTRTELDCCARGVHHHVSGAVTVVDIGGQDAKVIHVAADGRRTDHAMNRKCASGTGSFLEEIALRLGVTIQDFPVLAARSAAEVNLASFCTVFAGTELLTKIREGCTAADLARAAYKSVVKRVLEMTVLDGVVAATGGVVAYHPMVVQLLSEAVGRAVIVPPQPQLIGALGAALAARDAKQGPLATGAKP